MFIVKKKINFYDCDPAGILFFGRVYELCHSAYEELIDSFNLNYDYWTNENFIVPIIKSEASYHKSIKYREAISIKIIVNQLKKTSFELEYKIRNSKGEKCVVVKTVHVFVDKNSWKKKEIDKDIFSSLSNYAIKK